MPVPFQEGSGCGVGLETFPDSESLDPKNFILLSGPDDAPVTFLPGDPAVGEQVLEFDGAGHSDRLKSISGFPVPEDNFLSDPFSVEAFAAGLGSCRIF